MDAPHTPDTATVRSIFSDYWHDEAISSGSPLPQQNREEFDRWLNKIRAEVWEEGRKAQPVYHPESSSTDWPTNPYRENS